MKYIFIISTTLLIALLFLLPFKCSNEKVSTIAVNEIIPDSLYDRFSESLKSLDSLKPVVEQTIKKIQYYENLKNDYEKQTAKIEYRILKDTSGLDELRKKLVDANSEIQRLRSELDYINNKRIARPIEPVIVKQDIEKPNDNGIIINLDAVKIPDNLLIYLIPYSKKVKRYMVYETSCDYRLKVNQKAKYYNGIYFFNDIPEGKYLIKICTYFGNYKLITKGAGMLEIKMQLSPPVQ